MGYQATSVTSTPTTASALSVPYSALYLLLLLFYIPALFVPLMDNDSAHHANIALKMYLDGNYTHLIDQGKPYLDKPHLLFWTSALSYHIFGVNAFAYKFPSFLFTILGTYATYRLGWLLYNKEVGKLAGLILATAFAYVLSTNDVRMDAMLTGSAIFAIWQLCAYIAHKKILHLVLAALGLAMAFATKGWVGAVVPAVAILLHLLYQRNWRMLFHGRWLLLILLFFVFISPVLYAYYVQFDLHPALEVRGKTNVSGVRFIFWDQNFERMQGESFSTRKRDVTFFLHTFLWAFLPWSLLGAYAIIAWARIFIATRFRYQHALELMTWGAPVFFIALFSLSKFKLPHYLNILFPLIALLLASHLYSNRNSPRQTKIYWYTQLFVLTGMALLGLALNLWVFPFQSVWVMLLAGLLLLVWLSTLFLNLEKSKRTVYWSVTGAVFFFFMHHTNFYPQLLNYQAGTTLAKLSTEKNITPEQVFIYQMDRSFSYDFNTAYLHETITLDRIKTLMQANKNLWIVTDEEGLDSLQKSGIPFQQQFQAQDYHVSKVKWKFLHPDTRQEALSYMYLIQL